MSALGAEANFFRRYIAWVKHFGKLAIAIN
jgi:hypothetical protein